MKWVFAAAAALAAVPTWGASDWKPVRNDPDLAVYERDVPGSDIVAFKFDGALDAPLDRVAALILDYDRAPDWVDHLEEERVLRQVSPGEFIEYTHIGTPFVMKDRDFVIRVRVRLDRPERRLVITNQSTEDPAAPDHGYVRGNLIGSTFTLAAIDGRHTQVTGEIQADPMGSVPKWIVNLFQRQWPRKTFDHLREQLSKSDVGVPNVFSKILSDVRELTRKAGSG